MQIKVSYNLFEELANNKITWRGWTIQKRSDSFSSGFVLVSPKGTCGCILSENETYFWDTEKDAAKVGKVRYPDWIPQSKNEIENYYTLFHRSELNAIQKMENRLQEKNTK
jgi:hypothetical protein